MVRKWFQGDRDLKILPTFWQIYKGDFLKANLLGLIIVVIGAILLISISTYLLPYSTGLALFYSC
ncbi:YesL family protein [Shouchella patagoniensis]|uniref:YesL family protein n=1 Tax=Shouchella patagoniensis TaxID=228576 RepID=UPI003F592B3A